MPSEGQTIVQAEHEAATKEGWKKNRWTKKYVLNTCGVRLSTALNASGYKIPEHDLGNNRWTWTSNLNPENEYIVSADEMGAYLNQQLGTPTLATRGPVRKKSSLTEFVDALGKWSGYKGLIYLDAKHHGNYGASGHVDLIHENTRGKKKTPWIRGINESLYDYVSMRYSVDFVLHVWLLDGAYHKNRDPKIIFATPIPYPNVGLSADPQSRSAANSWRLGR